jgi:hypothetical protein
MWGQPPSTVRRAKATVARHDQKRPGFDGKLVCDPPGQPRAAVPDEPMLDLEPKALKPALLASPNPVLALEWFG